MNHVVTKPTPPFEAMDGAIRVIQVPAAKDNLVWLVQCTETGVLAAVDGPSAHEALAWCDRAGMELDAIFNTHTHEDHIGINRALAKLGRLESLRVVGSRRRAADIPGITEAVDEGDTVRLGSVEGEVMLTEGHIDGHICFVFGDVVFCGDTMFAGGCGYLFDGPPSKMYRSLMRLAGLGPEVRVCCAHEYTEDNLLFAWSVEPDNAALLERIRRIRAIRADGGCTVPSTIAEERATNPFLRPGSPTLIEHLRTAMPHADLSSALGVFTATRALKNTGQHKQLSFPA